jgi:hypothetical protein
MLVSKRNGDLGKIANKPGLSGLGSDLDRWQKDLAPGPLHQKKARISSDSLPEDSSPETTTPSPSEDQTLQESD